MPRTKKWSDFSIVFSDPRAPLDLTLEEKQSRKHPEPLRRAIRVEAIDPWDKIDSMSRLDWMEVPVVEHNVMAKKFGKVDARYQRTLMSELSAANPKFRQSTRAGTVGAGAKSIVHAVGTESGTGATSSSGSEAPKAQASQHHQVRLMVSILACANGMHRCRLRHRSTAEGKRSCSCPNRVAIHPARRRTSAGLRSLVPPGWTGVGNIS